MRSGLDHSSPELLLALAGIFLNVILPCLNSDKIARRIRIFDASVSRLRNLFI